MRLLRLRPTRPGPFAAFCAALALHGILGAQVLQWPASGHHVSGQFYEEHSTTHEHHTALDITSTTGDLIVRAAAAGTARRIPNNTYPNENHGMGNVIIIDHGPEAGIFTLYAHLASITLPADGPVSAGQAIGVMGDTGGDYPVHLHFEVKVRDALGNLTDDGGPEWGYTPDHPNLFGFINPYAYLEFPVSPTGPVAVVATEDQIVRTAPDTSFTTTVGTISAGQKFVAFAQSGSSWFQIFLPSLHGPATGWIQARTDPETIIKVVNPDEATAGAVNLRATPSVSSPVVRKAWDGQWMVLLAQDVSGNGCSGAWYQVAVPIEDGDETAWICSDYVVGGPPPPNTPPAKPVNIAPQNGATGQPLGLILQSSLFSDPDGDEHTASQWRVLDATGTNLVWDSGEVAGGSMATTLGVDLLASATTYTWQVRYRDDRFAWSDFSDTSTFTTLALDALDLTAHPWIVTGQDTANWNRTMLVFTRQTSGASGFDLEGVFNWYSSGVYRGREFFSGTLSPANHLHLVGHGLVDPAGISLGVYDGTLQVDGSAITNGEWSPPGGPVVGTWSAARVDLAPQVWRITGQDIGGESWNGSEMEITSRQRTETGFTLNGHFDWFSGNTYRGREYFHGTLDFDFQLRLDGFALVHPIDIITGHYEGQVHLDGARIEDGTWFGEGAKDGIWSATRQLAFDVVELREDHFVFEGDSVTLTAQAIGPAPASWRWQRDGVDVAGATGSELHIPSAQKFHAAVYRAIADINGSDYSSNHVLVDVYDAPSSDARLLNLSTRALDLTGDNLLIPGFVISGTGTKRMLIRGVGPGLFDTFQLAGTLADPQMSLTRDGTLMTANDDWGTAANPGDIIATSATVGAFPLLDDSKDAVLLVDLPAGQYTAPTAGAAGGTGIAMVELYDADASSSGAQLVNISNRGFVDVGDRIMIPGFVVSSEGSRTFLIRAVGPGLTSTFGLSGVLADPVLNVFSDSDLILTNDDWGDIPTSAETTTVAATVGAFPLQIGSQDAAFVVTLPPGHYTVHASGANSTTGIALVEIYLVP